MTTTNTTQPTIRAELQMEAVNEPLPIDSPFVVWVDSREQLPYQFEGMRSDAKDGGRPLKVRTEVRGLDAGDYTIENYAGQIAVERKSLGDLYSTLAQGRKRFERELTKLNEMEFAAVVVEASWPDIALHPPLLSRMIPKSVVRSIFAFMVRHPNVHWLPMGSRRLSEAGCYRLLERFWKDKNEGRSKKE